jgi:hypothetical protein
MKEKEFGIVVNKPHKQRMFGNYLHNNPNITMTKFVAIDGYKTIKFKFFDGSEIECSKHIELLTSTGWKSVLSIGKGTPLIKPTIVKKRTGWFKREDVTDLSLTLIVTEVTEGTLQQLYLPVSVSFDCEEWLFDNGIPFRFALSAIPDEELKSYIAPKEKEGETKEEYKVVNIGEKAS